MSDVTLSAAVRSSLLSLQNTTNLIDRTQNRLSSGLAVASAIDDPVAFFQAKTLNDRAFDFVEKKDGIDQGISTVSAALEGIEAIEAIVRQLKGVSNSLKSATGTQFTDLITQFNSLRTQIGNLADDATYQGTNLINNTSEILTVSFSEKTASLLTVNAVNVRESGLSISQAFAGSSLNGSQVFNYSADTAPGTDNVLSGGETILVTFLGTARTFTTAGQIFNYGTVAVTLAFNSAEVAAVSSPGDIITLQLASGTTGFATGFIGINSQFGTAQTGLAVSDVDAKVDNIIIEGKSVTIDFVIDRLDSALVTLRSNAQTLGSNVALLQTRLDFTEIYVNTLEIGASKLTLADINEEGANLLALQTRQQLGISALAFAGQAEQGILALFR